MNAKWTLLVYMAGDNDLERAAFADIAEMQAVGSSDDVQVIVMLDTRHHGTRWLRIRRGGYEVLAERPDANTGDEQTLADFVRRAIAAFPADRYGLVVWNHGGGLEDGEFDYDAMRSLVPGRSRRWLEGLSHHAGRAVFRHTREALAPVTRVTRAIPIDASARVHLDDQKLLRAIAIDVSARDYLDNLELRRAVAAPGVRFDLLGCDACLMNMLEIAYEMRGCGRVMVGSEENEPGAGWPYHSVLGSLVADPDQDGARLGAAIVRHYDDAYSGGGERITQSALDLDHVEPLVDAVDRLGAALLGDLGAHAHGIGRAFDDVLRFATKDYADLGDLCALLQRSAPGTASAQAAQAVFGLLDPQGRVVIERRARPMAFKRASGVSICLPVPGGGIRRDTLRDVYSRLEFARRAPAWVRLVDRLTTS